MKGKYLLVMFFLLWAEGRAFNPVMPYNLMDNVYSFRSLSTGFVFWDYIDYAQNPLLLTKADKNAIFTGLSNLNASEFLFGNAGDNDIKLGGIYHSGIGSEGLLFTMRNQRDPNMNPLGVLGEVTIDSTVYEDTDADGYPDIRRWTHSFSNAWYNNTDARFSLSFYLDREDYGLGFFFSHVQNSQKNVAGGDTLNPYGVFVFNEEVFNNATGLLISTVDGLGDGSQVTSFNSSLGAIGANLTLGDRPLSALLVYRDEHTTLNENYTSSILRNNAPLEPNNVHYINNYFERSNNDDVYFKRVSLLAIQPDSEFDVLYAFDLGISMHSGKIGTLFDRNMRVQEDNLSDSIRVNINRNTTITSLGEPEGTGYDGYFTLIKGMSLGDKASMRFGFSIYGMKDKVKRHVMKSDTTYNGYRDGDIQPNDFDDFDDILYSKVEYDSTLERTSIEVTVPCGLVYKPHRKVELRLGAVEHVTWTKSQNYIVVTGLTPQTREVIRGDGTHTITKNDLAFENSNVVSESLTPITSFYYGLGFDLTESLSVDIMNFSNLVNLNNWQVSVVFKF